MFRHIKIQLQKLKLNKTEYVLLFLFILNFSVFLTALIGENFIIEAWRKKTSETDNQLVAKLEDIINRNQDSKPNQSVIELLQKIHKDLTDSSDVAYLQVEELQLRRLFNELSTDRIPKLDVQTIDTINRKSNQIESLLSELKHVQAFPLNQNTFSEINLEKIITNSFYIRKLDLKHEFPSNVIDLLLVNSVYSLNSGNIQKAISSIEAVSKATLQSGIISSHEQPFHHNISYRYKLDFLLRKLPSVPLKTHQKFASYNSNARGFISEQIRLESLVISNYTYRYVRSQEGRDFFGFSSLQKILFFYFIQGEHIKLNEYLTNLKANLHNCKKMINLPREENHPYSYVHGNILYGIHSDLTWELTLKILEVKELATALKKYPKNIKGIEISKVCSDLNYEYKSLDNGNRMYIGLAQLNDLGLSNFWKLGLFYETKSPLKE